MGSGAIPAHLRFHQHEVTFPLPKSDTSNKYDNFSGAALALAPDAAVFPGSGRLLGSADDDDKEMKNVLGASIRSYAEEEAARRKRRKVDQHDDKEMKNALEASLRSYAEEQASRRKKRKIDQHGSY